MKIDCKWIENNLEALFSGTLGREDRDCAQRHIENCGACGQEIAALNSIDPLVKRYFQSELNRVRRASPRTLAKGRLIAVSSAALVLVCFILIFTLRTAKPEPANPPLASAKAVNSAQPLEASPSVESTREAGRAKPVESGPNAIPEIPRVVGTADNNAPEFMVIDPAGYSRTLNEYRGYVFVLGILKADQSDAMAAFQRLYKQFGSNPKFRFLAVSSDRRELRPAKTTFPIAYNQGSKLFGAAPGDFVLLDDVGSIHLRGSLVKDFSRLETALREK
jgi:hypothetical protein